MGDLDHVDSWDLTCAVTTGFIGKGVLRGYHELRKFSTHHTIAVL